MNTETEAIEKIVVLKFFVGEKQAPGIREIAAEYMGIAHAKRLNDPVHAKNSSMAEDSISEATVVGAGTTQDRTEEEEAANNATGAQKTRFDVGDGKCVGMEKSYETAKGSPEREEKFLVPMVKENEAVKEAPKHKELTFNPASEGLATNITVMTVVGGNRKEQTGIRKVEISTARGTTNTTIRQVNKTDIHTYVNSYKGTNKNIDTYTKLETYTVIGTDMYTSTHTDIVCDKTVALAIYTNIGINTNIRWATKTNMNTSTYLNTVLYTNTYAYLAKKKIRILSSLPV